MNRRYLIALGAIAVCTFAWAKEGEPACNTLEGWDAQTCDTAAAMEVIGLANLAIAELPGCGELKKKGEIIACSDQTRALAVTLGEAAVVVQEAHRKARKAAKHVKAKRSKSNRMEGESTDE